MSATAVILHPSAERERAFVVRGRQLFREQFPTAMFRFVDPVWNVRSLDRTRHRRSNARAHFTRLGSVDEALPDRYADVLKAACVKDLRSKTHLLMRLNAGRVLWEAIVARVGDSDRFTWSGVSEADFLEAEQRMLQRWSPSTTYVACNALQRLIEVLSGAGIISFLRIPFRTRRPESSDRYLLAERGSRAARLPSEAAMQAVADIYAAHAVEPRDRLVACALALLAATGMRIGEVLTLPADCLVSQGEGADRVWGIRFNKEKSKDRRRALETRWLTPRQSELAQAAIAEVRELTAAARTRASVLEADPETVSLPGISPDVELNSAEIAKLLGCAGKNSTNKIPRDQLPRRLVRTPGRSGVRVLFRAADVMRYLRALRGPLWVVQHADGSGQMLSESLFVVFRHFLGAVEGTNPLLVELVSDATINGFLSNRSRKAGRVMDRSAFERFGLRESDGFPVQMSSHAFRHWVTTQAAAAGVDDATLARWQNREHVGDLEAYKHLTPEQRVATLKAALKRGQLRGRLADMYFAIEEDLRDVFLKDQLQAVHVTAFGLCVHDFKVAPCPKALNCVKQCRDFLHDTGDSGQRRALIQLEERVTLALDQAEQQQAAGEADLSINWVADLRETSAGVRAILDAGATAPSQVVQPFADHPSRFTPMIDG